MGKSKEKKTLKNAEMTDEAGTAKKVDQMKNRATIKKHGVDNSHTYEHPASFAATSKQLDQNSLKHFV
jgi:hypothetical protein